MTQLSDLGSLVIDTAFGFAEYAGFLNDHRGRIQDGWHRGENYGEIVLPGYESRCVDLHGDLKVFWFTAKPDVVGSVVNVEIKGHRILLTAWNSGLVRASLWLDRAQSPTESLNSESGARWFETDTLSIEEVENILKQVVALFESDVMK